MRIVLNDENKTANEDSVQSKKTKRHIKSWYGMRKEKESTYEESLE